MGRDNKYYKSAGKTVKIKYRVESCRKQMLLGNVTRITWITAMTQSGSRIGGQVQTGWADLALYE